jgi:hypothetical protein
MAVFLLRCLDDGSCKYRSKYGTFWQPEKCMLLVFQGNDSDITPEVADVLLTLRIELPVSQQK